MKVTVSEAAKELKISESTLRGLMQEGKLNIGYAMKREGKQKWGYWIYRTLLDAEKRRLGLEV
jgi:hypothetical protein